MEALCNDRSYQVMKVQNMLVNYGRWLEKSHRVNTSFAYEEFLGIYDYEKEKTQDEIDDINKMAIELLCFISSNQAQGVDMVINDNHNYQIVSSTQEFFEKIGMEFVELRDNLVEARYINELGNDIEIRYNDKDDFEKTIILEIL